jgi:hypothetical protein
LDNYGLTTNILKQYAGASMNRKDLIEKYKQTIPPMGIYQIRNMVNGKVFVGSSLDLKGIINRSQFQLKNGLHVNREMQEDFSETGEAKFSFEVLDQLKPIEDPKGDYGEELKMLEEMWLEKLQPHDERGYNARKG